MSWFNKRRKNKEKIEKEGSAPDKPLEEEDEPDNGFEAGQEGPDLTEAKDDPEPLAQEEKTGDSPEPPSPAADEEMAEPGSGAEADEDSGESPERNKNGLFRRFREKLTKTRTGFGGMLESVFSGSAPVDEDLLEELEEILITSDLGLEATTALLEKLRKKIRKQKLSQASELREALKESLLEMFSLTQRKQAPAKDGPEVILIVGVNGVGKTTTIGKLAHQFVLDGRKVMLAAGDTFRAAAGEQLEIWAQRVKADIVRHQAGADPSAVIFDALEAALARKCDVVLVDTAGRLHTRVNLMAELKKIRRIMDRKVPGAPHQTILILDATTGQNAISQARIFNEATPLTGLIMTKLDGTAKGGIVAAVSNLLDLPVHYVGLGEQMDDLREFDPRAFVEAVL